MNAWLQWQKLKTHTNRLFHNAIRIWVDFFELGVVVVVTGPFLALSLTRCFTGKIAGMAEVFISHCALNCPGCNNIPHFVKFRKSLRCWRRFTAPGVWPVHKIQLNSNWNNLDVRAQCTPEQKLEQKIILTLTSYLLSYWVNSVLRYSVPDKAIDRWFVMKQSAGVWNIVSERLPFAGKLN